MLFTFPTPETGESHKGLLKMMSNAAEPGHTESLRLCVKYRDDVSKALSSAPTMDARLNAIENYLPYAIALVRTIPDSHELVKANKQLRFTWKTGMTDCSRSFSTESMRYDLIVLLMTYAELMYAKATTVHDNTKDDDDFEHTSKLSTGLLGKAAGVADHVFALLTAEPFTDASELRPPEILEACVSTFIELCQADAQQVSIWRAVQKGSSPALLAKLALNTADKYVAAETALSGTPSKELKYVTPRLAPYIATKIALWRGVGYKFLAKDAHKSEAYGDAVAFADKAVAQITSALAKAKSASPRSTALVAEVDQEMEDAKKTQKFVTKDNDTVYFEKVPDFDTLKVPEGVSIMKLTPYTPPPAAFHEMKLEKKGCSLM